MLNPQACTFFFGDTQKIIKFCLFPDFHVFLGQKGGHEPEIKPRKTGGYFLGNVS